MKSKITSVLILLAAAVFAFAETAAPAPAPACAEKTACCKKEKPKTCARKGFPVMHILLSLSDEQLDDLAKRIAEVRKMTPEEKAKALKELPKPKMPRIGHRHGKRFCGKPGAPRRACGKPVQPPCCAGGNCGKNLPPPPPPPEKQ